MNLRRLLSLLAILILLAGLGFAVYLAQQSQETRRRAAEGTTATFIISDNFDGTSLDSTKWGNWTNAEGGTFSQADGKLVATMPQQSGAKSVTVWPHLPISGDFTAEVELSPLTTTGDEGAAGFVFDQDGVDWKAALLRHTSPSHDKLEYNFFTGSSQQFIDLPPATGTIKLKLVRTGSTFQGFYDLGNGYQAFGEAQNIYSGGGIIKLETGSWGSTNPAVTAKYDNFTITGNVLANTTVTDDFNAGSLDNQKWRTWKTTAPTTDQENGVFRVTIPSGQSSYNDGVIRSRQTVVGDFEVQADLKMESVENKSNADVVLQFVDSGSGENRNIFHILIRKRVDQTSMIGGVHIPNNPQWQEESKPLADNDSGRVATVKMARSGDTISFYYRLPGEASFNLLGTQANVYSGPGEVLLFTNSWDNFPAVTGTFDNFKLVTNLQTASPSPSPSSLPDIGGGEDCDAPISPQNVKARPGSKSGEILISWIAAPGATHYAVNYGTSSRNYIYGAANVGNVREYTVKGLNPGTTYYLAATAVNACGSSSHSTETSAVAYKSAGSTTKLTPTPSTTTFIPSLPSALPTLDLPSPTPSPSPEPSAEPQVIVEPQTPQGPNKLIYLLGGLAGAVIAFFLIRRFRQKLSQGPNITQGLTPSPPPPTPSSPPPSPPSETGPPLPSSPSSPSTPPPAPPSSNQ